MGFFKSNTTSSTSTITGLTNQVILSMDSNTVAIGILFNPTNDILFVYKNSVYLSPDNYDVVGGNIVSSNGNWSADTCFDFMVQRVT